MQEGSVMSCMYLCILTVSHQQSGPVCLPLPRWLSQDRFWRRSLVQLLCLLLDHKKQGHTHYVAPFWLDLQWFTQAGAGPTGVVVLIPPCHSSLLATSWSPLSLCLFLRSMAFSSSWELPPPSASPPEVLPLPPSSAPPSTATPRLRRRFLRVLGWDLLVLPDWFHGLGLGWFIGLDSIRLVYIGLCWICFEWLWFDSVMCFILFA